MIYTIGEALIDLVPAENGRALKGCALNDVAGFGRAAGGAPANVACAAAKLGGSAAFIGKVGDDAFGDYLVETMNSLGVDTTRVFRTKEAGTALGFVSLAEDGNREFAFYRNPGDMLLGAGEIDEAWFQAGDIVHFGSVDLIDAPIKAAQRKAIEAAKARGGLISFDPNVRLPLRRDPEACRSAIREFLPLSRFIKISEEELAFVTGIEDESEALRSLFAGDVQHVLYTRGARGAEWISERFRVYVPGVPMTAIDTTGAGDAFMGALLYQLQQAGPDGINELDGTTAAVMLRFANTAAAIVTQGSGAIPALPSIAQVLELLGSPAS